MRYTEAYLEFASWLRECSTARKLALDLFRRSDPCWKLVWSSVYVVTHARFERYFCDVLEQIVFVINTKRLNAVSLPGYLREILIDSYFPHTSLQRRYVFKNDREYFDSIRGVLSSRQLGWDRDDYHAPVNADDLLPDSRYPSFDNLAKTFHKLGVDFHAELSRRLKTDGKFFVEEVGGLRCQFAHQGIPNTLAYSDMSMKLGKLSRLVRVVDDIVVTCVISRIP